MMYGWSKWGGGTKGLSKETLDEWYCQVCGEKQTSILPSYMFPMDCSQRDFARVCAYCKAKARINHINLFWDLVKIIKKI